MVVDDHELRRKWNELSRLGVFDTSDHSALYVRIDFELPDDDSVPTRASTSSNTSTAPTSSTCLMCSAAIAAISRSARAAAAHVLAAASARAHRRRGDQSRHRRHVAHGFPATESARSSPIRAAV